MKDINRSPRRKGAFCWSKTVNQHSVLYRLFRRDHERKTHMQRLEFQFTMSRENRVSLLLEQRRRLREVVDSLQLNQWYS